MTKSIPLTKGKFALVDDSDYEWINGMKWTYLSSGYAYRKTPRPKPKAVLMHRLVLSAKPNEQVDHINGNKLDNRRVNLRVCTSSQNNANKPGRNKYKGVQLDKRSGKYYARIAFNYKIYLLGSYETEKEAAIRYNEEAIKIHGIFARLNEIK